MAEYEFHKLCLVFPPCTDAELRELQNDIANNGLRTPITLHEGKILDGRNRAIACENVGIEPRYKNYTGDDPLGFVVSKNICRRHLSESDNRYELDSNVSCVPDKVLSKFRFIVVDKKRSTRKKSIQKQKINHV